MMRNSKFRSWLRILMLAAWLWRSEASGATWYMSPIGTTTNGTLASPWSVPYATGETGSNPYLNPGDTVTWLSGSLFNATNWSTLVNITNIVLFRYSGTPAAPITYRAEKLWESGVNGGISLENSSNLVVWGLKISHVATTNRTLSGVGLQELPGGINEFGNGNKLVHNLIENTGHPGIGSWSTTAGKYIAGNVIRFVGMNDLGGARGSGMYLQNLSNSSPAVIRGNISYHNYTTGMKAYGNLHIWGFEFTENFLTDCYEAGIFWEQDDFALVTPNPSLLVASNVAWRAGNAGTSGSFRIGYQLSVGGHSNLMMRGNYGVEYAHPFQILGGWNSATVTNNIGVNFNNDHMWTLEGASSVGGNTASHLIDKNEYWHTNTHDTFSFVSDVAKTFAQWKVAVGDSNSVETTGFPQTTNVFVVKPSYDSNFLHIAVINWKGVSTVSVDVSSQFAIGDRVRFYDAQAIPNAYATNTLSSTTVTLDLARTNRSAMNGSFTIGKTNDWLGFDAPIRNFVLYREQSTTGTNQWTFNSTGAITIPSDTSTKSTPWPSVINVAGIHDRIIGVKININSLLHTFTDDIDMMLQSPDGKTVMLMSDAASDSTDSAKSFSFSDLSGIVMADASSGVVTNGTDYAVNNWPTQVDVFPDPAPPLPYGTNLSRFFNAEPNGDWKLWVADSINADGGSIASWSITLTTVTETNIIPSHRLLSWSDAITGVPGGIPTGRTQFCNVKVSIPGTNIVAVGDGVTDDVAALTAAWNRCPTNAFVYMPTGRYWCPTNFTLQGSYRTLRGDGTNTVLVVGYTNTSSVFLNFGSYSEQGTQRTNIVDIPVGATNTTWDSVNGLGALFPGADGTVKFWFNDGGTNQGFAAVSDGDGSSDPVHYSGNGSTKSQAGAPLVRFEARITGTNVGNQVFFWPPSPYFFPSNSTRSQYLYVNELRFSGLEDFSIECNGRVSSAVYISQGMGSWTKGLYTSRPVKSHIGVAYSTLFEITECFVDGAPAYGPSQGIGIQLDSHTYGGKVYNNIGRSNFPFLEIYLGGSGSTIAYNYIVDPQGGLAPIDNHNGHNFLNLIEGNVCYGIIQDGYFGSAEAWTLFRNWFHGDAPTFGARKILNLGHWTRNWNEIGNVWGNEKTNWGATLIQSGWNNSNTVIRRFGYPNMGNDNFSGTNLTIQATNYSYLDFYVWSNHIAHANVEFGSIGTKTTNYSATITNRVLPYSYFTNWNRATPPSWWTNAGRTNAPWPPIGPDVSGNTNLIPAMMRFHNLGVIAGGGGEVNPPPGLSSGYDDEFNRILKWFFFPIITPFLNFK